MSRYTETDALKLAIAQAEMDLCIADAKLALTQAHLLIVQQDLRQLEALRNSIEPWPAQADFLNPQQEISL